MPFKYGKAVKTKTISTVKSKAGLEKVKHVVGRIYTVVSKLNPKTARKKITKTEFNKIVSELKKQYTGKAKLLHVGINELKKQLTVQYTPITSFWVLPALPLIFKIIAIVVALAIAFTIIFSVLYIGARVVPELAGTLAGITPLVIVGGLILGGYLILKKPETAKDIYLGAERRVVGAGRAIYGAIK